MGSNRIFPRLLVFHKGVIHMSHLHFAISLMDLSDIGYISVKETLKHPCTYFKKHVRFIEILMHIPNA